MSKNVFFCLKACERSYISADSGDLWQKDNVALNFAEVHVEDQCPETFLTFEGKTPDAPQVIKQCMWLGFEESEEP